MRGAFAWDGIRRADEHAVPILVFIHIAKTAGTTVNFLLEREFFKGRTVGAYDNTLPPMIRSTTGIFEPEDVARLYAEKSAAAPDPIGFVSGHMRYGLHSLIDRPCIYITFLRHPLDRVVSAYNYVRELGWLAEDQTIDDFIDFDFLGNSNAMVRQLVHDRRLDTKEKPALRKHARAVTPIDVLRVRYFFRRRFLFAAPSHRVDDAVTLLAKFYGWSMGGIAVPRDNVSTKHIRDVSARIRTKILRRNRWDALLYEQSVRAFDALCERAARSGI